jgi:hypothetical protein
MLQAHSFLWNYLWVAPNLSVLLLGVLLLRRGLLRSFPAFLAFAFISPVGDLAAYFADIIPSVTPENFWRVFWINLILESLLKFLIIGDAFSHLLSPYPTIARLGKKLLSGFGATLVLVASVVAAFAGGDSKFDIIFSAHVTEQTVFVVESGLIVFLFCFAAHFHLSWERLSFGILVGLGVSSCEHLATWAIIANTSPSDHARVLFDFLNMATYHFCVLIWFYYLLVPGRVVAKSAVPLPENTLAVWNRELERLLQQ